MGVAAFESDGGGGRSSWWSVICPESRSGRYRSAVVVVHGDDSWWCGCSLWRQRRRGC
jgi:hypothetical protein